jgi:hypothetical protein
MTETPQISALEASHLAYNVFIYTLEVLAKSPEEQCETMGDYNTAWELRHDALNARYLIGSGFFTDQQECAVLEFLAALELIPVNDMPSGAGREPNLAAMQSPAWEPIRLLSLDLLATLASVTEANQAYLGLQSAAT